MTHRPRCRCLKAEGPHLTAPLLPTICSPARLERSAEGPPCPGPLALLGEKEEEEGQGLGLCCMLPPRVHAAIK